MIILFRTLFTFLNLDLQIFINYGYLVIKYVKYLQIKHDKRAPIGIFKYFVLVTM